MCVILHRLRHNEVFLQTGNDVMVISPLGGAAWNFRWRFLKGLQWLPICVLGLNTAKLASLDRFGPVAGSNVFPGDVVDVLSSCCKLCISPTSVKAKKPYWKATLNFSHLTSDWNWLHGVLNTLWNCTWINVTLKFNQSFAWFPQKKNVTRPAQCSHMGTLFFKIIFMSFAKQVGWNFFNVKLQYHLTSQCRIQKNLGHVNFFLITRLQKVVGNSEIRHFRRIFFVWRWRISQNFVTEYFTSKFKKQ